MAQSTRQLLLELAVKGFGRTDLAQRLNVPTAVLDDWLSGQTALPDAKLLALIEVLDETI
ncbi:MAG TPA: hypothetical protein VL199_12000 [Burkholderiales bacterium]|nr:hypothetical protein [Burkholderiales bacterium]